MLTIHCFLVISQQCWYIKSVILWKQSHRYQHQFILCLSMRCMAYWYILLLNLVWADRLLTNVQEPQITWSVGVNKRTYEVLTPDYVMEAILVASSSTCKADVVKRNNTSGGLGRFNGNFPGPPVSHRVLFNHAC